MPTAEYLREWRKKHPNYYRDYQRDLRASMTKEERSIKWKGQKERYRNDDAWREKKLAYNRAWRHKRKLQQQAI